MKQERLRILGALVLTALTASFGASSAAAQAKLVSGKLAGVVRDTAGTPQMGASVELVPETAGAALSRAFLTNTQGVFRGEKLTPGLYTLRITLAGFLPILEKHVRINPNLTTVLRFQLESMFASLDQLRRVPSNTVAESDDWKWVLRSASATRPVLEWRDDPSADVAALSNEITRPRRPRGRLELTDGARRPGSVSNLASSPSTAFAYDQKLEGAARILFAGQMSYQDEAPAGAIAAVWLPTGTLGAGPHTALVLREAKLGPDGPTFRGVRIEQGGALAFGDRFVLDYGSEYVLVGLGAAASSIRPRAQLNARISDDWHAALTFASMPSGPGPLENADSQPGGALAGALNELDAFPALMWRAGRPVLQSGWHEEVAAERKVGAHGVLQVAGFHDDNRHEAVFGRGTDLPTADYFQDYFSNGFAYDGGSSSSWGARAAFREKLEGGTEFMAVYSFSGALTPSQAADGVLREILRTAPRHSLAGSVSTKLPRTGTKINAGYKWISGTALSRVDPFGESLYQLDPYLHVGVRQPLPRFALGRWEAVANCDNLLAQGYVSMATRDGRMVLVPTFRTFRGGLSLQF